jgi:hypoxanthine phosphoribosyltransferase
VKPELKVVYSAPRIVARVAAMGRAISRDYAGRVLDVVVLLENAFVFAGDLIRQIRCPSVCHFVRLEMRDIQLGGYDRTEIFFTHEPDLRGRHVLIVDTVLQSGVTMDFLVKRLQETRPRSIRVAVLLDRPRDRRVNLQPDYFGFAAASNYLVGYGLPGKQGLYRGLPFVGTPLSAGSRARHSAGRSPGKRGTGLKGRHK